MRHLWPVHGKEEIDAAVAVLKSGKTNYWTGGEGVAFEEEFADYVGAKYALCVSSGTTALELALSCYEQFQGSEVIVPCRTFVATASAVFRSGMTPILADIGGYGLNVTDETLEARRWRATSGAVVVHYAGAMCDMPRIMGWAERHGLFIVEDCAHAHGSRYGKRHAGTFGHIGCFSFCVGKTMSTGGEGGMVVTDDKTLYDRMRAVRDHGRYQMVGNPDATGFQYTVDEFGTNFRMTEVQSAIGRAQLRKLDEWVRRRSQIASRYDDVLRGQFWIRPGVHGRYMYVGFVDDGKRDGIMARLNAAGVPARVGGCPNIGMEPVFRGMNLASCPEADRIGRETLSLPCYPTMTDDEVDFVVTELKRAL